MPTRPGSRGCRATTRPVLVSWIRTFRIERRNVWDCPPRLGVLCRVVSGSHPKSQGRLGLVEEAFRTLPERYLGAEAGFDATYHVRLGDVGHTWEVRCTTHGARVRKGVTNRKPDVTIGTDS